MYKVSQAIEQTYQAADCQTGLSDVQMNVYDETHTLDAAKSGAMTEIGSTGRYYRAFTPDAQGDWTVMIDSATKPGKVVKHYKVGAHDVDSVGQDVAGLNDLSSSDVDTALADYDAPTKAELDTAESNIRGGSETLETVKAAVVGLGTPPMVG